MTDFDPVSGFEDLWRPPVRPRIRHAETVLRSGRADMAPRARLRRLVARAPEVMVKITGRTRDPAHLRAHLDYIARNGSLTLEDQDGLPVDGRAAVRETADDWGMLALADSRRRANSPVSLSMVLSMPAGTDAGNLLDAARAFARDAFGERHDYVLALHTDADHPHVHLSVRCLGYAGERLNPRKADLEAWRQTFAAALRDRGILAEATPRRARGVTRKAVRIPIRKIADRHRTGEGPQPKVRQAAYREAARAAFQNDRVARPWETAMMRRQATIRARYVQVAERLGRSPDIDDRALGLAIGAFLKGMPEPDSQRLAMARALRQANAELDRGADRDRPRR